MVLKDLKLKAEALNSLKLPVTVKAGFVGSITLKVLPYTPLVDLLLFSTSASFSPTLFFYFLDDFCVLPFLSSTLINFSYDINNLPFSVGHKFLATIVLQVNQ